MNGWTGSALESNRRECMPCQAKDKTREVFCSALREQVLFFRPHFWVVKSLSTIQHTREIREPFTLLSGTSLRSWVWTDAGGPALTASMLYFKCRCGGLFANSDR